MSGTREDPFSAADPCLWEAPELLCLAEMGGGSCRGGAERVMMLMPFRFSSRSVGLGRRREVPPETDGYGFLIYFLSTFQLRSNKPRINLITLNILYSLMNLYMCPLYAEAPEPIWQHLPLDNHCSDGSPLVNFACFDPSSVWNHIHLGTFLCLALFLFFILNTTLGGFLCLKVVFHLLLSSELPPFFFHLPTTVLLSEGCLA